MRRALARLSLFTLVLSLPFAAAARAESPPEEDASGAVAAGSELEIPDQQGSALPGAAPAAVNGPEQAALARVAERYATRLRNLVELARQAKGAEQAAIQRRIEVLKLEQIRDELEARMAVAREAGDEALLRRLEEVSEEPAPPRADPSARREFRPAPQGGGRGGGR